jgi:hypothetical protein
LLSEFAYLELERMCWFFYCKSPPIQKCERASVRDWDKDPEFKGLPVRLLISWSTREKGSFLVFINEDNDVDYKTTGDCDQLIRGKDCSKVLSRIAVLEAVPISNLPEKIRLDFAAMLGEGLARAMNEDAANAKTLLDAASQFISARNQEVARRWLLSAAGIATAVVVTIAVPLWLFRTSLTASLGNHFIGLLVALASGALGSLFSVLTRAANIPLDPAAGKLLHCVEGAGHVVAGMIGAIFVYFAMKAGVFAPKLLELGLVGQALACMVGGASERLVPTIIRKVDVTKADSANRRE